MAQLGVPERPSVQGALPINGMHSHLIVIKQIVHQKHIVLSDGLQVVDELLKAQAKLGTFGNGGTLSHNELQLQHLRGAQKTHQSIHFLCLLTVCRSSTASRVQTFSVAPQ